MSNYIYTNDGLINANELAHYGVPGMRWGHKKSNPYVKRAVRGHAGPGIYLTKKRQLAGDKRDLEALNKGQHLSVGLTKKRQAAYDARDRARLEERIAKNEKKLAEKKAAKKAGSGMNKIVNKKTSDISPKAIDVGKTAIKSYVKLKIASTAITGAVLVGTTAVAFAGMKRLIEG